MAKIRDTQLKAFWSPVKQKEVNLEYVWAVIWEMKKKNCAQKWLLYKLILKLKAISNMQVCTQTFTLNLSRREKSPKMKFRVNLEHGGNQGNEKNNLMYCALIGSFTK